MFKLRCLKGMDSIQVAGKINGKPCPVIIDSGANQTIIKRSILGDQELPRAREGLSDVTGRRSALWGPVEVQLWIGDVRSTHRVNGPVPALSTGLG